MDLDEKLFRLLTDPATAEPFVRHLGLRVPAPGARLLPRQPPAPPDREDRQVDGRRG
jgi:hypothetical protein